MIEVFPNLYVGSGTDLIHVDDGKKGVKDGWFVVSAARDPWHREALGYTGRGAPKDHSEYLMAARLRRLILNLVDAADPAYIREEIMDAATRSISDALDRGDKVLIHCNQGGSRAPGIALMWLRKNHPDYAEATFAEAVEGFTKAYPDFAPAAGIRGYLEQHWNPA